MIRFLGVLCLIFFVACSHANVGTDLSPKTPSVNHTESQDTISSNASLEVEESVRRVREVLDEREVDVAVSSEEVSSDLISEAQGVSEDEGVKVWKDGTVVKTQVVEGDGFRFRFEYPKNADILWESANKENIPKSKIVLPKNASGIFNISKNFEYLRTGYKKDSDEYYAISIEIRTTPPIGSHYDGYNESNFKADKTKHDWTKLIPLDIGGGSVGFKGYFQVICTNQNGCIDLENSRYSELPQEEKENTHDEILIGVMHPSVYIKSYMSGHVSYSEGIVNSFTFLPK